MKLSIIVVCWNDGEVIRKCLRSIYNSICSTTFEIIICDNNSTDGSVEVLMRDFPKARIIRNKTNLGFAKAMNIGIRASVGEFVLILNPDTVVQSGNLDDWVEYADSHRTAGAFGCRIVSPNGAMMHSAAPFPTIWRYWTNTRVAHSALLRAGCVLPGTIGGEQ